MKIKHIDNVLTKKVKGVDFWILLNLWGFMIIFFFENKESAPCSILKNIFRKSLSTKVNKALKDFLRPKLRKFIDLTAVSYTHLRAHET